MYPRLRPKPSPFLKPELLALLRCVVYLKTTTNYTYTVHVFPNLSASLYSPPKAMTVFMDDNTSSARAPAVAYAFCSALVNLVVT